MEVRYEINDCGHIVPMEDDVFWRYIRLLADSLYLKMPVAVSTIYSKERILFMVNEAIKKLDEKGRDVIKIRYGLMDSDGETLKTIAEKYKVSNARARELVTRNLIKIRTMLQGETERIILKNNYYSQKNDFERFLKKYPSDYILNKEENLILDLPIPDENKLQALLAGITTEREYLGNKTKINEEAQAYQETEHIITNSRDSSSWLYSDIVVIGSVSVRIAESKLKATNKLEDVILNKEGVANIDELARKAIGNGKHFISKPAKFMLHEPLILADLKRKAQSTNKISDIAIGEIGKKYRIDIAKTAKIDELIKQCGLVRTNDEEARIRDIEIELAYVFKDGRGAITPIDLDCDYRFTAREIEVLRRMAERCAKERGKKLTVSYDLEEAIVRLAEIKRRKGAVTKQDIDGLISEYGFSKTKIGEMLKLAEGEGIIECSTC